MPKPVPPPMPEAFLELGRPLAYHPGRPPTLEQMNAKLKLDSPAAEKWFLVAFGAALLIGAGVLFWIYLFNPPKNENPQIVLGLAIAAAVIGAGIVVAGLLRGTAPTPTSVLTDYAVYPDGVASLTEGELLFMNYADVVEHHAAREKMAGIKVVSVPHRFVGRDGTELQIANRECCEGWAELLEGTIDQVVAAQLPGVMKTLDAGKKVVFGPFKVGLSTVIYKDKKIRWDEVASLVIHNGQVRIGLGNLLPFSLCPCGEIPNYGTFYQVLRRVVPARLLVER